VPVGHTLQVRQIGQCGIEVWRIGIGIGYFSYSTNGVIMSKRFCWGCLLVMRYIIPCKLFGVSATSLPTEQCSVVVLGLGPWQMSSRINFESLALALKVKSLALSKSPWPWPTRFLAMQDLWFLADRTNGRAIATLLRLSSSSVCLWRYVLWLNGAS